MSTAVCFDLDGTLVEFTVPYETILEESFDAALGYSTPELLETYNDAFYEAFLALESEPYLTGMRAVRSACNVDVDADLESLVDVLREHEFAATRVETTARSLLASFGERHHLGVVTNGVSDWQEAKLRYHDLGDVFNAVVCSYDVGTHKPDPDPFEAANESLDADTCVMIGDDYAADIEGARNAGFVPVHLTTDVAEVTVPDLGSFGTLLDALR
jgi:putative hydrolase of the HAD superfamily